MRASHVLARAAVGLVLFSGCKGGGSPRVVGGAGAEGTENTGAEGGTSGEAGELHGLAGDASERRDGSAGTTASDDDDDDTNGKSGAGGCEDGTLGCACYGNDTCNEPYPCENGLCVDCDDGDEGCSCYGNDTCNGQLTCKRGTCVDERAQGQGGAPAGTGGSSPQEQGGASPEGAGGNAPEGGGGSPPEGTGGSSPEGTGGQPEGTGGQVEGTGGQVEGTGGSSATGCANPYVIDDFEDGDHDACPRSGWTIDWWADGDDYGSTSPNLSSIKANKDVLNVAVDPARGTSQRALRLQGYYFDDWGAEIGLTFNNPGEEVPDAVDLTQYSGITFWTRGTGTVQLQVPTVDTMPAPLGGLCSGEYPDCYDYFESGAFTLSSTWTQHTLSFGSLEKGYAGTTMSSSDKQYVLNLLFYVGNSGATFDLWLDDVAFF